MSCRPPTSQYVFAIIPTFAVLWFSAVAAFAQPEPGYGDNAVLRYYRPVSPYPVEMGFTQHHSSTAYEGALRGRAALVQAWGNYQLNASQAELIQQQTRALQRENALKQTEALYAQKQMWNQARVEAREQREAALAEVSG